MIFGKEYFEKVHRKGEVWGYEDSRYEQVKYTRQIEAITGQQPSARDILEIGCSEGIHTLMMASAFPAARITCIDISPQAIKHAAERCRGRGGISFQEGDIIQMLKGNVLPLRSFDVIVQSECLYYLFPNLASHLSIDWYIKGVTELLRPGGVFVTANGITFATKLVMQIYYRSLRKSCSLASAQACREWSEFRHKHMNYELMVFRKK